MLDFDSFAYFESLLALGLVAVPVFHLLPWSSARCGLLGTIGAYLLFLIAPRLLVFYLLYWLLTFGLHHLISAWPHERSQSIVLALSIGLLLAPMVIWKVAPTLFIIEFNVTFNDFVVDATPWLGAVDWVRDIILPIGLSFATFRAIDLLVKTHLELVEPLSPTRMYAFGFFPPVQVIGPVIEVTEIRDDLDRTDRPEARSIVSALVLIGIGLAKVYVVSFVLEASSQVFNPVAVGPAWEFWFELLRFGLFFYFNFSGFSDIAVGTALLFGFKISPNFNNPYVKTNPQDFWNSWHMSLTKFCQRNVFVPLGGMRRNRQYPAILATIMVIALWHDVSIPLVMFGVYHGCGLVLHRFVSGVRPAKTGVVITPVKIVTHYTYFCLSLPLLLLPLEQIPDFYGNLNGFG